MNYRKNSKVLETYLDENGVMRFNLNSPENLNALSENMMDLIQNSLDINFWLKLYRRYKHPLQNG